MINERSEQEATDREALERYGPPAEKRRRALLVAASDGLREAIGLLEIAAERYRAADRQDRAADIDRALEILGGVELR